MAYKDDLNVKTLCLWLQNLWQEFPRCANFSRLLLSQLEFFDASRRGVSFAIIIIEKSWRAVCSLFASLLRTSKLASLAVMKTDFIFCPQFNRFWSLFNCFTLVVLHSYVCLARLFHPRRTCQPRDWTSEQETHWQLYRDYLKMDKCHRSGEFCSLLYFLHYFYIYFFFPNGPRAGDPSRKTGCSSRANGCSAIFSERATKPCEQMGASTARVVKLFERVGASAERVIKPCERVGASIERVIKPVERVSASTARVTQAVRMGAMFFKTGNTLVVNGFPFANGKPLVYVFAWEVTYVITQCWWSHRKIEDCALGVGLLIWWWMVRAWSLPSHCFLRQETFSTLSLFTQLYKWVPAIIMLGGGGWPCNGLASHPGGSSNIPSRFMLQKLELSAGLMGHLARKQTYYLTFF